MNIIFSVSRLSFIFKNVKSKNSHKFVCSSIDSYRSIQRLDGNTTTGCTVESFRSILYFSILLNFGSIQLVIKSQSFRCRIYTKHILLQLILCTDHTPHAYFTHITIQRTFPPFEAVDTTDIETNIRIRIKTVNAPF